MLGGATSHVYAYTCFVVCSRRVGMVAPLDGATMPTLREQTTQHARAETREVAPPRTTWWVPPHPSLARMQGRAHRGKGRAHGLYSRDVQALLLCLIERYHAGTRPRV